MFKSPTISSLEELSFISFWPILASLIPSREVCSLSLWFSESVEISSELSANFSILELTLLNCWVDELEEISSDKLSPRSIDTHAWMSRFLYLLSFKKWLIFYKKLFVSKSLPERFKCRLSFQRRSVLIFELSIQWKLCMRHLAFRVLFTALIKAELRQVLTARLWLRGVVIITTAQLHPTKPELRFCAGSNPARGVSEIPDGEDLWQRFPLELRLNVFRRSTIPQKQFIIIIIGPRQWDCCLVHYVPLPQHAHYPYVYQRDHGV